MNKFILFVNGRYKKNDQPFYEKLVKGKKTIAVDGGYKFFRLTKTQPNIILGDFDSIGRLPKNFDQRIEIIKHPERKDKTDLHLALEYCLKQRCKTIDIVMPDVGEVDHFIGNIFLLLNSKIKKAVNDGLVIKFVNLKYLMTYLIDSSFTLNDSVGDRVSVVPISKKIILSCSGMDYNVSKLTVHQGDSVSLRNIVTSKKAKYELVGQAVIIKQHTNNG